MKRTVLVLVFFVFFAALNGFGQNSAAPVNSAFVDAVQSQGMRVENILREGGYYLSRPFEINLVSNSPNNTVSVNSDGVFEFSSAEPEKRTFTTEMKGQWINSNAQFFDILFRENDALLKFQRNPQRDRFELVSATISYRLYTSFREISGEIPYLVVYTNRAAAEDNSETKIEATLVPPGGFSSQQQLSENNSRQPQGGNFGGMQQDQFSFPASVVQRGMILGGGQLFPGSVVAYIDRNTSRSRGEVEDIVNTYFRVAGNEGINPDIAIAQMIYATNSLGNSLVAANNFAGLSTAGTYSSDWPGGQPGRFPDRETGIRAHIQHLKAYTGGAIGSQLVDPRYRLLGRITGSVQTFDQLYQVWVPHSHASYKAGIEGILSSLYQDNRR